MCSPFGRLLYAAANAVGNATGYAQRYSRSQDAVIRVCNAGRRRDREARAQRRFQRVLSKFALTLLSPAFRPSPLVALCRSGILAGPSASLATPLSRCRSAPLLP